jgi:hypothetical protein
MFVLFVINSKTSRRWQGGSCRFGQVEPLRYLTYNHLQSQSLFLTSPIHPFVLFDSCSLATRSHLDPRHEKLPRQKKIYITKRPIKLKFFTTFEPFHLLPPSNNFEVSNVRRHSMRCLSTRFRASLRLLPAQTSHRPPCLRAITQM